MNFLTQFHRWMGVFLCLFFAMWFLSGAILIYHPFPSLSQPERLASSHEINFTRVKVSPFEAIDVYNGAEIVEFRMIDVQGMPVYVLHPENERVISVNAENGRPANLWNREIARKIAEKFSGNSVLKVEGPLKFDQWIVPNKFDAYRPFFRIFIRDQEETILYVSARTGEVLQKTVGKERLWNYMGAVLHWIYPTVLRSNWALWDEVVWWLSLLGVIISVVGLYLGLIRWKEARKMGMPSPFEGWLRYHHILGLFTGITIFTWIFSGWLSMDHGRIFSMPNPNPSQLKDFQGQPLKEAIKQISARALDSLKGSKEVEFFALGGKTFILSKSERGLELYKPQSKHSLSSTKFIKEEIISAVKEAWPGLKIQSAQRPEKFDVYASLREGSLPQNTLRVILDDPKNTWVHIDMESGKIISIMDRGRRFYRWIFNGLHSLDFPGLSNNRPLWDILILSLLAAGFIFSITGVVLGWKRFLNH